MRKLICSAILCFVTVTLSAQQDFSGKQKQVQQGVINMFEALSDRDSVALKMYCSPDIRLYEYGQIWTIDTLIFKAITTNQSPGFKRSNSFEFLHTETNQKTAWVTYRLHSIVTKDGKETRVEWLETAILNQINEKWLVKHLHSTLIKRN
jgi:Domain of unknown function (DUF4440)